MKIEVSQIPKTLSETWPGQFNIFSWMEFVTAIPQAISVVTTYKENGLANACPQSWTLYSGDGDGYYVVFSVIKRAHTYKNILRKKEFVVNFPVRTSSGNAWTPSRTTTRIPTRLPLPGLPSNRPWPSMLPG